MLDQKIKHDAYKEKLKTVNFKYMYFNGAPYKKAKEYHDEIKFMAQIQPDLMPLFVEASRAVAY
jgi:hypothetical protein